MKFLSVDIDRSDVLYELPEQLPEDVSIARAMALGHLRRVRAAHGDTCPNCGADLSSPQLLLHRALDRGICTSAAG
jgi:hypothetical protein